MAEKGPEAEFENAREAMELALRSGIKAFAEWMAKEWVMTREEWIKSFAEPPPPDGDHFASYNAGVESVLSAYQHFIDEYDPR
jgi:hypothetical protein